MTKTALGLTNNQLKIVAMITMLLDHMGVLLFPHLTVLRYIGRVSFPIYAYMIAEGCAHTRNRLKYFLKIFLLGAICQVVMYVVTGSLHQGVLITFSISIAMIFALDRFIRKPDAYGVLYLTSMAVTLMVLFYALPKLLPGTDYTIDYRIWGILLPVAVYFIPNKPLKLLAVACLMFGLVQAYGDIQYWAFFALPVLALYNGTRGQWNMKYLFYFFYPAHLAILYGIQYLIQ